jgi:deoxyribodipyrimidine photolyase-related protein
VKLGPKACPFNYLYWDFLMRNEARLTSNPRLAMPYRTLAKMDNDRREQIAAQARDFLASL